MQHTTDASASTLYFWVSKVGEFSRVLRVAAHAECARHCHGGVGDRAESSAKTEPCAAYVMSGAFAPSPAGAL